MDEAELARQITSLCEHGNRIVEEHMRSFQTLQVSALDIRDTYRAAQGVKGDLEAILALQRIPEDSAEALERYIAVFDSLIRQVGPFIERLEEIGVFTALPLDLSS